MVYFVSGGKTMKNKDRIISFRVTKEEYQKIKQSAHQTYRSISNWIRKQIVEGK